MFAGGRLKASGFQPTHPHGVRPVSSSHVAWMLFSFNPRARTGCDAKFQNVTHVLGHVSTHAPARGATFPDSTPQLAVVVSTHAPARGATDTLEDLTDFELVSTHAPARGATIVLAGVAHISAVSTHAPARGATGRTGLTFQA